MFSIETVQSCLKCSKIVRVNVKAISCDICKRKVHFKCTPCSNTEFCRILNEKVAGLALAI